MTLAALPRPPRALGLSRSPALVRLGVILLLLLAWEVAARFGDRLFVAPPTATLVAGWALLHDGRVVSALGQGLWEILVAFGIAAVGGAAIGALVGRSRIADAMLYPVVLFLYALPQAPLLPLFVLAFGIGAASKIAFGVSHAIFTMIITLASGLRSVDPGLLRAARSMGASRLQVLRSIVLPSALASFFTGLRLAMSGVLLGVMLAELFVSQAGIGFYTHRYADAFEPANLLALIAMLAAIAVTLNEICRTVERRFSRWRS